MSMADVEKHHHNDGKLNVRFPDGQSDNCNEIHILQIPNKTNEFEIQAGFFKTDHKYEVAFSLKDEVGLGEELTWSTHRGVQIVIKDVIRKNSEVYVTLEYSPEGKIGIIKEQFSIMSKDQTQELKASFRAEVLGQDQGTPMLKDGVRCTQRVHSASSVSSD